MALLFNFNLPSQNVHQAWCPWDIFLLFVKTCQKYGWNSTIFSLKMMMKSSQEKIFLKFSMRMQKFQRYFSYHRVENFYQKCQIHEWKNNLCVEGFQKMKLKIREILNNLLKFIYSKNATNFCAISTIDFAKFCWFSQNIWTLLALFLEDLRHHYRPSCRLLWLLVFFSDERGTCKRWVSAVVKVSLHLK